MIILQSQEVTRPKLPNVFKKSVGIWRPEEGKILIERLNIQLCPHESGCEDSFYLRGENKTFAAFLSFYLRIIERLDAHPIPHQDQRALAFIPKGKRKHTVKSR